VNEARESQGLPPLPGDDGNLTVAEFKAKHEAIVAAAAAADSGGTSNKKPPIKASRRKPKNTEKP